MIKCHRGSLCAEPLLPTPHTATSRPSHTEQGMDAFPGVPGGGAQAQAAPAAPSLWDRGI